MVANYSDCHLNQKRRTRTRIIRHLEMINARIIIQPGKGEIFLCNRVQVEKMIVGSSANELVGSDEKFK